MNTTVLTSMRARLESSLAEMKEMLESDAVKRLCAAHPEAKAIFDRIEQDLPKHEAIIAGLQKLIEGEQ